jgi:hypothetical protein
MAVLVHSVTDCPLQMCNSTRCSTYQDSPACRVLVATQAPCACTIQCTQCNFPSFCGDSARWFVHTSNQQVYAYNQRFHGDSDSPSHGFHVARLAADLRDFLAALQLTDVTVVGSSMGCAVIWSYVELFGLQRLKQAVFVVRRYCSACSVAVGMRLDCIG